MKRILTIIAIVAAAVGLGIFLLTFSNKKEDPRLAKFAQCLAEKKVTMYGAAWCSHCQNQKNAFGDAFKYVPYVECPDNPQLCLDKGVTGYPTWIFPDGKKIEGELELKRLSEESGCPLESE